MDTNTKKRDEVIEEIRKNVIQIETLETLDRDSMDFAEKHWATLRAALVAAYEAGKRESHEAGSPILLSDLLARSRGKRKSRR